jgi:SAM-dependent methyltransferase
MSRIDYAETPYPGFCYPKSSPARLATVGRRFGLSPPPLATARVLEFGSGVGGNLLPLAARFPKPASSASIIPRRRRRGAARRRGPGARQLDFLAASILDLDPAALGRFDYIVAHGFYSWVGPEVRERMMALTGAMLSPQGVAYVSFNTLPGWNAIRNVRDAMLFHAREAATPRQRAEKARAFLAYLTEHAETADSPYRRALANEARIVAASADAFLLHDYMEEVNEAFYLSDFLDHAARHGLQYLGDASLSKMPWAICRPMRRGLEADRRRRHRPPGAVFGFPEKPPLPDDVALPRRDSAQTSPFAEASGRAAPVQRMPPEVAGCRAGDRSGEKP